jgi:hypothetical protein
MLETLLDLFLSWAWTGAALALLILLSLGVWKAGELFDSWREKPAEIEEMTKGNEFFKRLETERAGQRK